jgi:predicted glycosyltransferase
MKRVLVAPLDWGLGHASRCIPLINLLLEKKCTVIIAGSGRSLELLKNEFPSLKHFVLAGYDPQYPSSGAMVAKMAAQLPRFLSVIRKEHDQIEKIVVDEKIDVVISDNRFGCWSARAKSVFITHQSNILMPKRFGWLQGWVRKMNHRIMKKFTVCWIPDLPGEKSLAGMLGKTDHRKSKALSLRHIGILSRFQSFQRSAENKKQPSSRYDLLCIFSGPEPQRTLLEKIVVSQLAQLKLRVSIVRGIPASEKKEDLTVDADVIDFATSPQLWQLINLSEIILARSGFSTVMDLATVQKKAIFIPTPGQTEQEYLAARLMEQKIAFSVPQKNFNLAAAMKQVIQYQGFAELSMDHALLHEAIDEVLTDGKIH